MKQIFRAQIVEAARQISVLRIDLGKAAPAAAGAGSNGGGGGAAGDGSSNAG